MAVLATGQLPQGKHSGATPYWKYSRRCKDVAAITPEQPSLSAGFLFYSRGGRQANCSHPWEFFWGTSPALILYYLKRRRKAEKEAAPRAVGESSEDGRIWRFFF